jgi:hypothetical protein
MAALLLKRLVATLGLDLAAKGVVSQISPSHTATLRAMQALALQQSLHQSRADRVFLGVPMVANVVSGLVQARAQHHLTKKLVAAQVQAAMAVQASAAAKAAAVAKGVAVLKVAVVVGGVAVVVAAAGVAWWAWRRRRCK